MRTLTHNHSCVGESVSYTVWKVFERAEVLSPNRQTIKPYATVRAELKAAGTPIPANDCWIAALARQHKLGLLSKDRHFDRVKGIKRYDW